MVKKPSTSFALHDIMDVANKLIQKMVDDYDEEIH